MKINFKKSKSEIIKETIKLRNENLKMRAKKIKILDILKDYDETHKNAAKHLKQIADTIRDKEKYEE